MTNCSNAINRWRLYFKYHRCKHFLWGNQTWILQFLLKESQLYHFGDSFQHSKCLNKDQMVLWPYDLYIENLYTWKGNLYIERRPFVSALKKSSYWVEPGRAACGFLFLFFFFCIITIRIPMWYCLCEFPPTKHMHLSYWVSNWMAVILQTTFSNAI